MATLRASEDHYSRLQRISALTLAGARRSWSRMNPLALDDTWPLVGAELFGLVATAQATAAESAAIYVPEAVAEQNLSADPVAQMRPEAFAGVASDGRGLAGLLYTAVVQSRRAALRGEPNPLMAGQRALDRIVPTEVADAGRGATSVAQTTRPTLTKYTRMLNPPSCSRCAILAGRTYWVSSFSRHPNCDCIMQPATEATAPDLTTDPRLYFDSLSTAQQNKIFGKRASQAIRDGADISQVVNANRGMYQVGSIRYTREGTTRRGYARTAPGSTVGQRGLRLTPWSIYKIASDRDEAVRLLRANGYIR